MTQAVPPPGSAEPQLAHGHTPPAGRRRRSCPPWLLPLAALLAISPVRALPSDGVCAAAQNEARQQQTRLLARSAQLAVLLLAERHTSAADHLWQRQTLEALAGQGRPLILGLEMVPAPRQPILQRYGAGGLLEEAFLQQVGWQEVWGHDPDLYLPLLRWARRERVPLLALNAEPELVRRVRREGLEAIPIADRQGIGVAAAAPAAYREWLEIAWRAHRLMGATTTGNPENAVDLERFIASQLLRDRAMAEGIAAARRRDPRRLVVVLLGLGHAEAGGVPRQLQSLGVKGVLSLQRPELPPGCGPAPAGARLGAYLESPDGRVWVRRVAPGSAAEAAGLRPGDRIVELNGSPVEHAGQVIRGVRLQSDGVPLRLTIEREGRRLQLELRLPPSSLPRLAARDNGHQQATGAT